jgi:ribonuclease HIII
VQLPKGSGYGVNQLAHAILQQASRRLRETLAEAG